MTKFKDYLKEKKVESKKKDEKKVDTKKKDEKKIDVQESTTEPFKHLDRFIDGFGTINEASEVYSILKTDYPSTRKHIGIVNKEMGFDIGGSLSFALLLLEDANLPNEEFKKVDKLFNDISKRL